MTYEMNTASDEALNPLNPNDIEVNYAPCQCDKCIAQQVQEYNDYDDENDDLPFQEGYFFLKALLHKAISYYYILIEKESPI